VVKKSSFLSLVLQIMQIILYMLTMNHAILHVVDLDELSKPASIFLRDVLHFQKPEKYIN
jgi:hypothetical protein